MSSAARSSVDARLCSRARIVIGPIAPTGIAAAPGGRPVRAWALGAVAIALGLATIVSGGLVLFSGSEARVAAGAVVPFVLWFNFVTGFVYVAAGIGLAMWQRWGACLALLLTASTIVASAAFIGHVVIGGAYETRTAVAMLLRVAVWLTITLLACRALGCVRRRMSM
jgi:hypothetical protein